MKKTLVALAALASMSAFAQSSVTITGTLDFGAMNNGKTVVDTGANTVETTTKTSQTSQFNSWTTNQVSIQGTEDMGGGNKASFQINSGLAQAATGASLFGSRDVFVAMENANMGKVQLGRFVTTSSLGFHPMSGAASTAVGSIYGMAAANSVVPTQVDRFGGAARMTAGDFERGDNKIQYTSPTFNGLTLNANYGKALSDNTAAATPGQDKTVQTGLGLSYVQGPLTVGFGTNTRKRDIQASAEVAAIAVGGAGGPLLGANAVADSKIDGKLNWLAASYDLGTATVYATRVDRKDASTTNAGVETVNFDAKVNQFGVKVPMGQFTFNASAYTGTDKRSVAEADDVKLSGRQLSAQYAMSKRTSLYALTGVNKIARDADNGTSTNRKQTVTMVGMLHSF